MSTSKRHVFVCVQNRPVSHPRGSCQSKGSPRVYQTFFEELERRKLWKELRLTTSGCLGPCDRGASVLVYPEGIMYTAVTEADVPRIVDEHLVGGAPVTRLVHETW